MRGLALILSVALGAAACGGRSQREHGAPAAPIAGMANTAGSTGMAGSAGTAGSPGLPVGESCLGLVPEVTEAQLRAAVATKLGLELPAGIVDASEPNAHVRGQQLVDAVELALAGQALPPPSRQLLRDFVGELIGEGAIPLSSALPVEEHQVLQQELDRFVEYWAIEQLGSIAWLLTGAAPGVEAGPQEQRAGIMTLGAFLARVPSPPARAMFLTEALACVVVPPPPPLMQSVWTQEPRQPAKNIVLETYGNDQTPCIACHTHYIGYAIALDRYDELGRYRESLNGLPIDTAYSLTMPSFESRPAANDGHVVEFATPVELGRALSQSGGVRACLVQKMNQRLGSSVLSDPELACLLADWEAAEGSFSALFALLSPRFPIAP